MNNRIPNPKIVRKTSPVDPGQEITDGEFASTLYTIWQKFNDDRNLAPFRHNLRSYYDEASPITAEEQREIRVRFSDPTLRIYILLQGEQFRWDNRTSTDRRIIYIGQRWLDRFEMMNSFTPSQQTTLRVSFMVVLIHGLGDYLTSWFRGVNISPKKQDTPYEGGTETEYSFFGGLIDGVSLNRTNNFRHDYVRFCLFDDPDRPAYYTIPDNVARELFNNTVIEKINPATLTKWSGYGNDMGNQLEICCGVNRVSWRPNRRLRPLPSPTEQPVVPGLMAFGQNVQMPQTNPPLNYAPGLYPQVQLPAQSSTYPTHVPNAGYIVPSHVGHPPAVGNLTYHSFGNTNPGNPQVQNPQPAAGNIMGLPQPQNLGWAGKVSSQSTQYGNYSQAPPAPGTRVHFES